MAKNGNGKNDLKPGNLVIAQKFRLFCTFNCAASPNVFQVG